MQLPPRVETIATLPVRVGLARRLCGSVAVLAVLASPLHAETLRQAMASAYANNPRLDAERARLRATDEDVPRAKAGFRPSVTGQADTGWQKIETTPRLSSNGATSPWGYSINVVQPVFSGFRTVNAVNEAEANVRAGRELLRNVEQQVLLEAVTAYCDVVRDQAVVRLREGNVAVLTKELAATEARREVREVTRTDVAQAQARRARALSQLDLARANLKASRAAFERVTGRPPAHLTPPTPPNKHLPKSLDQAIAVAEKENPNVVAALYREQAARHAIGKIRGELLPDVRLEASYGQRFDATRGEQERESGTIAGRVTIPLYEGGETYARVRQAKHTQVSRLQEIEQARSETQAAVTQAWSRFHAARSQLKSDQVQVEANRTALEGVREEERVGQRTLLELLNAEQELLDAEVQLVITRRELIVAAYTLLQQMGRLNAEELGLADLTYDATAHYEEVRSRWFGLDITRGNGRREAIDVTIEGDPEWLMDE